MIIEKFEMHGYDDILRLNNTGEIKNDLLIKITHFRAPLIFVIVMTLPWIFTKTFKKLRFISYLTIISYIMLIIVKLFGLINFSRGCLCNYKINQFPMN